MSLRSRAAAMLDSNDRAMEMHLALGALAVLVFLALSVYVVVWRGAAFDQQAFGTGLGAVFIATGIAAVGQGIQRRTQDGPVPPAT